ncbi:hypothetical protein KUTeg_021796 [Tegillarca granosa]|uniref:Nose resistant-to-fluoxetine protein N-terminal domain-containing protein n=1 Tax=Tegillarca granosa TaxID=220873 RepID=A0ABQ9E4T5_TEGGR|nr:hypothetical protein KUTeg_021796 [Tegillarca granosa]
MKKLISLMVWLSVCVTIESTTNFHDNFAYHHIINKGIERMKHKPNIKETLSNFPLWNSEESFSSYLKLILSDPDKFLSLSTTNYNLSDSCLIGMEHYFYGLRDLKIWAIEMFDSTGKLPSGILQGDLLWPGQFDQCVNISAVVEDPSNKSKSITLQGKYFSLSVNTSLFINATIPTAFQYENILSYLCFESFEVYFKHRNLPGEPIQNFKPLSALEFKGLVIGICLPSSCTEEDVKGMVHAAFYLIKVGLPSDSPLKNISSLLLDVHDPTARFEARPETVVAIIFSCVIGLLVVIGTSKPMDYFSGSCDHYSEKTGMAGSNTTVNAETSDVSPLFSDESNVTTLTLVQRLRNPENIVVISDWIKRWSFQAVLGGFFAVDSFYLLRRNSINVKEDRKIHYLERWTTCNISDSNRNEEKRRKNELGTILLPQILEYWSDGPFWPDRSPDYNQCTKYWWRNLLYIQNFFPCMAWSWYLANDMQFFIISPLILIPLYRKPLIGYVVLGVLFLEQFIFRGVISVYYQLKMNGPQSENFLDWFDYMYQRPYTRISPYLIGMIVGYILWKTGRKVHLPKVAVILGWIISLVCVTSVVYGSLEENQGHLNSIITSFLSSPLWGPLSQLTYCAYLLHPIVLYVNTLTQRYPIYFSDLNVLEFKYFCETIYMFFGNLMLTYLISFVVSLTFEVPLIGLERLFWRK